MQRFVGGVPLAVAIALGCGPPAPPGPGDVEAPRLAALALERSRSCADELARLAAEDPRGVARALAVAPIRLAPYGGPAFVPLRAEISERLEGARADAAAAAMLARARDDATPPGVVEQRALRSIKASTALCRSADALRQERLARLRRG